MKNLSQASDFIAQAHWHEALQRIPSWTERGIRHGFEGRDFAFPPHGISLQQIHSPLLIVPDAKGQGLAPGDGLVSVHPEQLIGVKTADCLPILISHPRGVMALHAGWKGLAADIVGAALQWMKAQAWDLAQAEFALGPCISLDSFEVGPEILQAFLGEAFAAQPLELAFASSKGVADRWHLDLALLALLQIGRYGVRADKIHVVRSCTKKNSELWHSYRREGVQAGRNWSWIQFSSPQSK